MFLTYIGYRCILSTPSAQSTKSHTAIKLGGKQQANKNKQILINNVYILAVGYENSTFIPLLWVESQHSQSLWHYIQSNPVTVKAFLGSRDNNSVCPCASLNAEVKLNVIQLAVTNESGILAETIRHHRYVPSHIYMNSTFERSTLPEGLAALIAVYPGTLPCCAMYACAVC